MAFCKGRLAGVGAKVDTARHRTKIELKLSEQPISVLFDGVEMNNRISRIQLDFDAGNVGLMTLTIPLFKDDEIQTIEGVVIFDSKGEA